MAQRLTYRRRLGYNTRSNKVRIVKTPGGKLAYIHLKKRGSKPKCGDCHEALQGIPALRPHKYATLSKRQKTVTRAYGGNRCGACVKSRIMRAFLIEEQKIVKKLKVSVVKKQQQPEAAAVESEKTEKATKKSSSKSTAASKSATKGKKH